MESEREIPPDEGAPQMHHRSLLILSSDAAYRSQVDCVLGFEYKVRSHVNPNLAIESVKTDQPRLLLVDEDPEAETDIEFITTVRQDRLLDKIPIVYTIRNASTEKEHASKKLIGVYVLKKPYRKSELFKVLTRQASLSVEKSWSNIEPVQRRALKGTLEAFNEIADLIASGEPTAISDAAKQCRFLDEAIRSNRVQDLLNGVKEHDNYTYVHSVRIATFLGLLGNYLGLKGDELNVLTCGGLLHDIGKLAIPHAVLNKPGRLSATEFDVMKSHVTATIDTLSQDTNLSDGISIIAGQHHEKIDGSGYPFGLKGRELNDLARMAAIADVFGALTDSRIYKPAMPPEDALDLMKNMAGHLDQSMLSLFRVMLLDSALEAS